MGFNLAFEKEKVKKCYLFEGFWMLWKWQARFSYLSISSDWPDQITWDLKFKLFMFFPTLDSNRKPICNANLEIFWKKRHFAVFKIYLQFGVAFFSRKKITLSENYALSDVCVRSHFGQASCEEKCMEHNSIMCSVVEGNLFHCWNAIWLRGKT